MKYFQLSMKLLLNHWRTKPKVVFFQTTPKPINSMVSANYSWSLNDSFILQTSNPFVCLTFNTLLHFETLYKVRNWHWVSVSGQIIISNFCPWLVRAFWYASLDQHYSTYCSFSIFILNQTIFNSNFRQKTIFSIIIF